MNIFIAPTSNASLRTKNRIKEHGPKFHLRAQWPSVVCLAGGAGIRVASAKSSWEGWLPVEEVLTLTPTKGEKREVRSKQDA